jgi:O-antigen/teichoic acid export membrane protein
MMGGFFLAHQELADYTIGYLVRAVVQPPILIALIGAIGPLSLIVAPILVEWGVVAYYLAKSRKIGLTWRVDKATAIELSKAGLPLSLAAVAYWLYRLAGPTSIAAVLTVASLGIYTLASRIIDQVSRFFGDFTNVLMPALWTELSGCGSVERLLPHISRINTYLVLLSCVGCNLLQAVSVILIPAFLPRFVSSVPILEILSFNAVLLTISMTPGLVLDSVTVNKQRLHVGIWTVGIAANYALNFAVLARGYGVRAIAWNDIVMQVFVDALIYAAVHKHLFTSWRSASKLYVPTAYLALGCALIFAVLRAPFWGLALDVADWKLVLSFVLRCGFVIAAWATAGLYLRRSDRIATSDDISRQTAAASTL